MGSAVDKSTGKKNNITITSSGGLSQDEIDRMVDEAEKMKEADEKTRSGVQAKNGAENLCYAVEKQLTELKEKISSSDKQELEDKMQKLRSEMATPGAEVGGEEGGGEEVDLQLDPPCFTGKQLRNASR